MSRARRVLAAAMGAVVRNSLLWPIAFGVLYALTGMEESSLFSRDSGWGQALRHVLRLLFLSSCFYVVWRQLGRERKVRDRRAREGAGTTTDSTGS